MYSESRVTRSKARSQGVNEFEELPLTSAKGRTTIKKPRERPAFFDVTNAERSDDSGEGQKPSSPIKNLTADFEPAEVETDSAGASKSAAAAPPKDSYVVLKNASVLDTVLPEAEKEPVAFLHQAASTETDTTGVPQAFRSAAKQDEVQPWAGSPSTNQDLDAGDQAGSDHYAKELTVTADPISEELESAMTGATPIQAQQSPMHNSVTEAVPSSHGGGKDEECADPMLNTSCLAKASAQEHDIEISAPNGTPQQLPDTKPSGPATISSTPATVRQPLLSKQPMTPDVPNTIVSQQIDAGHLLSDSLTPKAAQSTPAGVASATAASRCQTSPSATMPFSPIPDAVGPLRAAYFSTEAAPDKTAVSELAESPLVLTTASPHKLAAPTEEKLQAIDILDAVYLSESDAGSAEDMGELAPFQHTSEALPSPQPSFVSGKAADDITEPLDINQSPLTPRRLSSPAAGTADMPALNSAMASEAFGSPMQHIPGSAARSAGVFERVYSASPAHPDHGSALGAAAWAAAEDHMLYDDIEGLDDRWQMDEDTAPMVSNTLVANVLAKVSPQEFASQPAQVSSQVNASPSYDPRSLKQLKKAVADKLAKKAAAKAQAALAAPPPTPAGLYESESDVDMSPGMISTKQAQGADDELCNALGSLEIQSAGKSKEPLRGLPVPQGVHIRFDDEGHAVSSPSTTQTRLRGVPAPRNSHIRFD